MSEAGKGDQPKIEPGRRAGGGLASAGEVADRTLLEEAGRDQ